MIKEFFRKKEDKQGTKNHPKNQQKMLTKSLEKDPKLFEKIAKEIDALKKAGKPEMYAALDVMKKYQKELQSLFKND